MVVSDLFEDQHVSAYRMTPDGRIVQASPALARLLGYDSVEELVARNQAGEEYDQAYVAAAFREHSGEISGVETVWRRKDGSTIRVRETDRAIYDDQDQPLFYDGIVEQVAPAAESPAPLVAGLCDPSAGASTTPALAPGDAGVSRRTIERLSDRANTGRVNSHSGLSAGGPMEILEYWKIIRKRLWLLVLVMLIGGTGTAYYTSQQPQQYRSTTTLFLNPAAASTLMNYQPYDGLQALARTYSEFMKSRSFASHVAQGLNGALPESKIVGALSTEYVPDTQFFRISATYSDPQLTQLLANTAAKALIAQNIARQQAEQEQIQAQSRPDPERQRLVDVRATLQSELDLYNGQITTLQSQLADLQRKPKSEENDKAVLDLQQRLSNVQSLRLSALTGLADTQAALTNSENNAPPNLDTAVVVDAALPGSPLPIKIVEYTLIALLASLTLAAGFVFLLEYMDYTIKTPEMMEPIYGIPIQGMIGSAGKRSKNRGPSELVTVSEPHSPIAEAFRALRTGVRVAGLVSPVRTLLITSACPGEGKTFVAANIAVSLAQNGSRVILVDADLRRPSLHYVFDLPLGPGFTNLVVNPETSMDDLLQATSVENLRVLTCGIVPPNPAELLGSPRAAEVMDLLAQHADIVIYDSPPAATVTDAVVIAPHVDTVLQVVRAGSTRIDLVRRCKAILERGGAHILGPVLNQVSLPELKSQGYYYSYSYHPNGNGRNGSGPSGNGRNGSGPGSNGHQPEQRPGARRLLPRREKLAKVATNGAQAAINGSTVHSE